jgi:hypothetical protein
MANQLPVSIRAKVVNKNLEIDPLGSAKLSNFIQGLQDGETVIITYEVQTEDASYAQVSKVHKHIRELANYTGDSFEDMKLQVKLRAGLCNDSDCRSFSDCSKEELSMAIQASIEIGELVGFSLY